MMDLMLPGREPEACDYEAQSALRTLLESEKIQDSGDEDLLERISAQIDYNQDMLSRVAALVEGLRAGKSDDEDDLMSRMARVFNPKGERYG